MPGAPPEDVKASALDSRSMKIEWKPPPKDKHNGPLVSYLIKCAKVIPDEERGIASHSDPESENHLAASSHDRTGLRNADEEIKISVEATRNSHIIKNLEEWTLYRLSVAAATRVGVGPASLNLTIRTDESGMFSDELNACLLVTESYDS